MFDIILKGGKIFDGDGKTPITTDLGIKDNIISEIDEIDSDKGKEVIDLLLWSMDVLKVKFIRELLLK